jgi:DeoR family fructose operon transcriptional repressor
VGADTVEALGRLRADVVFLGTNGISADHGLSTPDHDEAATKRAMVHCARRAIVLCDASKVGVESPVRFADLDEVDVLVTDDGAPEKELKEIGDAGVEIVIG